MSKAKVDREGRSYRDTWWGGREYGRTEGRGFFGQPTKASFPSKGLAGDLGLSRTTYKVGEDTRRGSDRRASGWNGNGGNNGYNGRYSSSRVSTRPRGDSQFIQDGLVVLIALFAGIVMLAIIFVFGAGLATTFSLKLDSTAPDSTAPLVGTLVFVACVIVAVPLGAIILGIGIGLVSRLDRK